MAKKYTSAQIVAHYASILQANRALPGMDEADDPLVSFKKELDRFMAEHDDTEKGYQKAKEAKEKFEEFRKKLDQLLAAREMPEQLDAQKAFDEAVRVFEETSDRMIEAREIYANDPEFDVEELMPDFDRIRDVKEDEYQGKGLFDEFSRVKSAAAWIDEIKAPIQKGAAYTAMDIARIMAARQLANCKRDDLATLKAKNISEAELLERANAIMETDAFKDFLIDHSDAVKYDPEVEDMEPYEDLEDEQHLHYTLDPGLLTDGHGGKFEEYFTAYIRKREDVMDLPKDLFGRYQPQETRQMTYAEYIESHKKDYLQNGGKVSGKDKDYVKQAAAMLAAFTLQEGGHSFSKDIFEKKTLECMKSPEFRYFMRNEPEVLNLASKGDFEGFHEKLQDFEQSLQSSIAKDFKGRDFVVSTLQITMRRGLFYGTQQERKMHQAYSKYEEAFKQNFEFMGRGRGQRSEAFKKMTDLLGGIDGSDSSHFRLEEKDRITVTKEGMEKLLVQAEQQRQELAEKAKAGDPNAKVLYEKLQKALKDGAPYFTPPAFQDGYKGKTAAQQLKAHEEKYQKILFDGLTKYVDAYSGLEEAAYQKKWKPFEKELAKRGIKRLKNLLITGETLEKRVETDIREKEYMAKRGPKFRAMMEAAKEYSAKNATDARATMDLVDRILDYQTGKEKLMRGNAKGRFDDSMTMLVAVTVGTPLEETILKPQIDKINRIRGAKPEDPSFIRIEDYHGGFNKTLHEKLEEVKEEHKGPNLNL